MIEFDDPEEVVQLIEGINVILDDKPEKIPMDLLLRREYFRELRDHLQDILKVITDQQNSLKERLERPDYEY